jgi:hypothetical protein
VNIHLYGPWTPEQFEKLLELERETRTAIETSERARTESILKVGAQIGEALGAMTGWGKIDG